MYQRVGKSAFKKDLTNTLALAEILGNPHQKFESIHIAGTNGKGTVAHAMASILQEEGYKVGLYTSPHLKSYRERIRVNGQMIEEHFVSDFVAALQSDILDIEPSFFEITVVMAFKYFAEQNVDIAVIETGLGGRLDSTNIVSPRLSIITSIGYDHQDMLGNTLEEIAFEKAGIIKTHVPCVVGDLPLEALETIVTQARKVGANLNTNVQRWLIEERSMDGYDFLYDEQTMFTRVRSSVKGEYFKKNLPTILESVKELTDGGFDVKPKSITNGIKNVVSNTGLRGRWQKLNDSPLTVCDVAHNEDGLREVFKQIAGEAYDKLHVVFGTVEDKKLDNVLSILDKNALYYFCRANIPRGLDAHKLQHLAHGYGLIGEVYDSVSLAIAAAQNEAEGDDMIFIGGSTFVVAEIENL